MANKSNNRFPPYNIGSSRDASSQPLSSNTFPASNWKSNGIWASHVASPLGNGETQASLSGSDEPFASSHQATNVFSTTTDSTDMWAHSARPWNTTDNTSSRNTSGSPSPVRIREAPPTIHDLASSSTSGSYLSGIAPAGSFASGRPKPGGSATDSNSNPFKYSAALRNGMADSDKNAGSTVSYSPFNFDPEAAPTRPRGSQDSSSAFSTSSGAVPVSGSSVSASVSAPSHHGHSHRTSLQASVSFPSPSAPTNAAPYQRHPQPDSTNTRSFLTDRFRQINLGSQAEQSSSASLGGFATSLSSYTTSSAVPFQFNPGSQPWDAVDSLASAALAASRDGLGNINRGPTPAGSHYRQLNSPRNLSTPANTAGPWTRPSSRDLRTAPFPDVAAGLLQRPLSHSFLQEQQSLPPTTRASAATPFAGNQNFFAGSLTPYSMYGAYSSPLQMTPLGIPLGTPFIQPPTEVPRDRDPTRAYRSQLLDDFRTSRANRRFELKDIYGHIVEFSGDQHGSRFIQSKLETANSEEKEHVFREISANTLVLMKDVFGNYVVQKFFEHGNQVQKKYLAEQMRGKMVDLSIQTYACRVVQKALQHILVDQQVLLAQELEADIIRVVKDGNGNHVVQKVIELVPREHIRFIMDAFRGKVRELSAHNYGCRVVQRLLEHGSAEDKAIILSELHESTQDLIMDQYGNYVAQHVIQFGEPSDREKMITKVLDQLLPMSKHKFASNVVEKCIEFGTLSDQRRIRVELNRLGSDGVPILQQMIKDQYGNYVIQKLLKESKGEERRLFLEALSTQIGVLKRTVPGRQNAAIDRLAAVIDEMTKNASQPESVSTEKVSAGPRRPASPQLQGDRDSTPSLTTTPNTPESSSPPSVGNGPGGVSLEAKVEGMTKTTHQVTSTEDTE